MNGLRRLCSGRNCAGFGRVGVLVEERRSHLRTSGVVNAGEENGLYGDSSRVSRTRSAAVGNVRRQRKVAVAAAAPSS